MIHHNAYFHREMEATNKSFPITLTAYIDSKMPALIPTLVLTAEITVKAKHRTANPIRIFLHMRNPFDEVLG